MAITRTTDETVVCERCGVADGPIARTRGLLGCADLPAGDGLLIRPASSIHTHFMRFAIDALFVDRDMRVLAVRSDLRPWRFAARRGAHAVLELRAGEAAARGIVPGDVLRLHGHDETVR